MPQKKKALFPIRIGDFGVPRLEFLMVWARLGAVVFDDIHSRNSGASLVIRHF